jgi:type I restriction enzyme S subunit
MKAKGKMARLTQDAGCFQIPKLLDTPSSVWLSVTFRDLCSRVKDVAVPSANGNRLYIGLEHLASGIPSLVGRGAESDVKSAKIEFKSGDVLFGKLRPYLRKSVRVTEPGICSTDIVVLRARPQTDPDFLCFLTQHECIC